MHWSVGTFFGALTCIVSRAGPGVAAGAAGAGAAGAGVGSAAGAGMGDGAGEGATGCGVGFAAFCTGFGSTFGFTRGTGFGGVGCGIDSAATCCAIGAGVMSCAVIVWTSTDFGGGALRWSHAAVSMIACAASTPTATTITRGFIRGAAGMAPAGARCEACMLA
ncbi:membrane hypothetical protein [Burkholderia cenocepacia]|nr:membrane hypothetical protein [Burkholderia cenocepacia]